jgi:hypothetical protein
MDLCFSSDKALVGGDVENDALPWSSGFGNPPRVATLILKNFWRSFLVFTRPIKGEDKMDTIEIGGTGIAASRIALGTWAIGGWMWGGTDTRSALRTVQTAIDHGINLIDTAPVYGFGRAEEIVGKALQTGGRRNRILVATKSAWHGRATKFSAMLLPRASGRRLC